MIISRRGPVHRDETGQKGTGLASDDEERREDTWRAAIAEGPSSSTKPRRAPRGTPTRLPRCSIDAVRDDRRTPAATGGPPACCCRLPQEALSDCFCAVQEASACTIPHAMYAERRGGEEDKGESSRCSCIPDDDTCMTARSGGAGACASRTFWLGGSGRQGPGAFP